VAKPKDRPFSFLVVSCRNLSQDFVNLLQLKTLGRYIKGVIRARLLVDLDRFHNRFGLTAPRFAASADLK